MPIMKFRMQMTDYANQMIDAFHVPMSMMKRIPDVVSVRGSEGANETRHPRLREPREGRARREWARRGAARDHLFPNPARQHHCFRILRAQRFYEQGGTRRITIGRNIKPDIDNTTGSPETPVE